MTRAFKFGCLFVAALIVVAALGLWVLSQTKWGKIDACLDAGGRWLYETKQCERAPA